MFSLYSKDLAMEIIKNGRISTEGMQNLFQIADCMEQEESYLLTRRIVKLLLEGNPSLYNTLKNQMIKLKDIFLELDTKSINSILKIFPVYDFYKLLTILEPDDLECFCAKFDDDKMDEIFKEVCFLKDKCIKNELIKLKSDFLEMYEGLMAKKKLPRNYKIELFKRTTCIPRVSDIKPSIILFTNKNTYVKNERVYIYAFAPQLAAEQLELNVYGPDEKKCSNVYIDEYGILSDSISIDDEEGIYNITLSRDPKKVLASHTFIIGEDSLLPVNIKEIRKEKYDKHEILSLKIENSYSQNNGKYKAELICTCCQNIIDGTMFDMKNGSGKFFIYTGNHNGPFLLNITSDRGNTRTLYIPEKINEMLTEKIQDTEIPSSIKQGEKINLKFHSDKLDKAIFVLSDNTEFIKRLESILHKTSSNDIRSKLSKINEKVIFYGFKLKSNINSENIIHVLNSPKNGDEYEIQAPQDIDNNEINLYFYAYYGGIWHKDYRKIHLKEENSLYLDFPKYIGPLDKIEGKINFIAPQKSELICKNGDVKKFNIQGKNYKPVILNSETALNIRMINNDGDIEAEWKNSERTSKRQIFKFLKKDEEYSSKNRITLYPDVDFFYTETSIKGLLNYPWGCGEQTASKIHTLMNLYSTNIEERADKFGIKNDILQRIEAGLLRMNLFEKQPGFYSLWENCNPDIHATEMIYNHLSIFYQYPIKEFEHIMYKKLEAMEKRLCIAGRKTYSQESQTISLPSDLPTTNTDENKLKQIMETAKLWHDDNSIYWDCNIEEDPKYSSYIYKTCKNLDVLYDSQINSIKAIEDIVTEKYMIKRNFIFTVLEKLGLSKALYEEKKVYKLKEVDDYLLTTINSLSRYFINYMIGSTSDTTAFMRLVRKIWGGQKMSYSINGHEIAPAEKVIAENVSIKCESDIGIIMEERSVLSEAPPDGNFSLKAKVRSQPTIPLGGIFKAEIDFSDIPIEVPYLTLYLPGNVKTDDPAYHIIDEQTVQIPIQSRSKKHIQLRGIRRGSGVLTMQVQDMYRPDVQGINNDIIIKVD